MGLVTHDRRAAGRRLVVTDRRNSELARVVRSGRVEAHAQPALRPWEGSSGVRPSSGLRAVRERDIGQSAGPAVLVLVQVSGGGSARTQASIYMSPRVGAPSGARRSRSTASSAARLNARLWWRSGLVLRSQSTGRRRTHPCASLTAPGRSAARSDGDTSYTGPGVVARRHRRRGVPVIAYAHVWHEEQLFYSADCLHARPVSRLDQRAEQPIAAKAALMSLTWPGAQWAIRAAAWTRPPSAAHFVERSAGS